MKTKLMIVIWNMGIGGIQKRVKDIIKDIDQNYPDTQVYLIIRRDQRVGFSPQIRNTRINIRNYSDITKPLIPFGFIFWLFGQYISIKPEVVLTFLCQLSIVMVAISRVVFWHKSRIILNEGTLTTGYLKYNRTNWMKPLIGFAYPKADKLIVPTSACKADLVNNFQVPEGKIKVIPNWTMLKAPKLSNPVYDLVYVGRFETEKNPLSVLEIVKILKRDYPDLKVILMGNGFLLGRMQKLISEYKISRNIKLVLNSTDTVSILKQAKILILTSYNEGLPNVVLEAAICGVPTVSSAFPGVDEVIVHGKTGMICRDIPDFVGVFKNLLKNPQRVRSLGHSAQNMVINNFSAGRQREFIGTVLSEAPYRN
jgi:glycosyltransferase involved in cell wall biosynthesis